MTPSEADHTDAADAAPDAPRAIGGLLDHLRQQGAPESQLRRLTGLIELARREPALLAIFLVGSFARGSGDRISDLDLAAFAAAGQGAAVLQAAQGVLEQAEVLNRYGGTHAGGGGFHKWVYLDFSSLEFHVFEPETAFRLKQPFRAVWDPHALAARYAVAGEPVRHEDFEAYAHGDDGLIWELVDCIKWLSRGRNRLAKDHLAKLAAAIARDAPSA